MGLPPEALGSDMHSGGQPIKPDRTKVEDILPNFFVISSKK